MHTADDLNHTICDLKAQVGTKREDGKYSKWRETKDGEEGRARNNERRNDEGHPTEEKEQRRGLENQNVKRGTEKANGLF